MTLIKKIFKFDFEDLESLKNTELKKVADYWLRQYLLKIAERNNRNQIYCPIKNEWYNERRINLSHFIDRACMNTRYDLDNCHLISEVSNMWDSKEMVEGYKSKHHKEYEEYLGEKKVKELFAKSKIMRIFTQEDYIRIIETFRNG